MLYQFAPVASEEQSGLTYESFYGLKEKPFSLTSDARFFYPSRAHSAALEALLGGIRRRDSLTVLTGDIGTGKTTLCTAVLEKLDRKTFSAFVRDPFATREDLLKVLLMDFGVASVDDLTSGRLQNATRTELSYHLAGFLATLNPLHAFAVVFIDEAQNLSVPLLEEVRILCDDAKLQVVLVGQLALCEKLKLPEMRQLDQRIAVHSRLTPLDCDSVADYVALRLHRAGALPDRIQFTRDAAETIYRASGGVPRIINRLCDRALHHAWLQEATRIDTRLLEASIPCKAPGGRPASIVPIRVVPPPAVVPAKQTDPTTAWLTELDAGLDINNIPLHANPAEGLPSTEESSQPRHRLKRKWTRAALVACAALILSPFVVRGSTRLWAGSAVYYTAPATLQLPAHLPAPVAPPAQPPAAVDLQ